MTVPDEQWDAVMRDQAAREEKYQATLRQLRRTMDTVGLLTEENRRLRAELKALRD